MAARGFARRRGPLLVLLAALAAAVVLALRGCGDDPPPAATPSLSLVPADALVAIHVSTDRERPAVATIERRLRAFPGWTALRDRLLRGLSAPGCDRPVERVAGREATLAIVPTGSQQAASLILVDTGRAHRRAAPVRCGPSEARYLGRYLVVTTPAVMDRVRRLHERHRAGAPDRSLAALPLHRRLVGGLPRDRVADVWLSVAGVRRVLAPRAGLLGALAVLLDRPSLQGVALSLGPRADGARVVVRSRGAAAGSGTAAAAPGRATAPAGAIGTVLTGDPLGAVQRLLAVTGDQRALGELRRWSTVAGQVDAATGGRWRHDLVDAIRGPSELVLLPSGGRSGTAMALALPVTDGARAGAALRLVARRGAAGGRVVRGSIGGRLAWSGRLAGGTRLGYLVDGNRVIAFTSRAAAAALLTDGPRIDAGEGWRRTIAGARKPGMSIGFLDFSQLLRTAERTGLAGLPEYRAARADLARVRAVGMVSRATGGETTAEIDLWIP
ncbi:hypothetical protein [Patulibacter defluvii]|uniref:hypothetical protein n=1 Tax=Patulibacter defluvii TaxID=3095358 RepID=UPI002A75B868|nr:hypothetical protein [Patulibacter sp. DM4]